MEYKHRHGNEYQKGRCIEAVLRGREGRLGTLQDIHLSERATRGIWVSFYLIEAFQREGIHHAISPRLWWVSNSSGVWYQSYRQAVKNEKSQSNNESYKVDWDRNTEVIVAKANWMIKWITSLLDWEGRGLLGTLKKKEPFKECPIVIRNRWSRQPLE